MILRLLGIIYAVAFLVAINEIIPLIGSDGLTPIGYLFKKCQRMRLVQTGAGFIRLPSIFWFWHSDTALVNCRMDWIYTFLRCCCRFCQCAFAHCSLVSLYVVCSCWTGMVWIRMGNTTY